MILRKLRKKRKNIIRNKRNRVLVGLKRLATFSKRKERVVSRKPIVVNKPAVRKLKAKLKAKLLKA